MFPEADIPVLQMSMPTLDPQRLFEIGRKLAPLRDEGMLIVGSGLHHPQPGAGSTRAPRPTPPAPGAVGGVRRLGPQVMQAGDVDAVLDFLHHAPGRPRGAPAHRALRAAVRLPRRGLRARLTTRPEATSVIDGFWYGLSKRSWQIG